MVARVLGKEIIEKNFLRFFRNFDLDSGGKVDFSFGTFYIKNYMRLKCFMSAKDCAKREIFFYNWMLNILYRSE